METQRISCKANLETAKVYHIREGGSFNFFVKGNLGVPYGRPKTGNRLHWS